MVVDFDTLYKLVEVFVVIVFYFALNYVHLSRPLINM